MMEDKQVHAKLYPNQKDAIKNTLLQNEQPLIF